MNVILKYKHYTVYGCSVGRECSSSGFLTEDVLREKAALHIPNFAVVVNGYILFEHLNITQDGSLIKWGFTAEDQGEGDGYPDLYIIRLHTEAFATAIFLRGSGAILTDHPNVYEYTLKNATQVHTGDIIAIQLPPISNTRLLLSFVGNGGPSGTYIDVGLRRKKDVEPVSGREGPLPLVTMEISKSTTIIMIHPHLHSSYLVPLASTSNSVSGATLSHSSLSSTPVPSTTLDKIFMTPTLSKSNAPSQQSSPQATLNQNPTLNKDDIVYWKIIAICSLVPLSIVTVAFTLGCVLFWLRKRKRNTKSVNNVTYHSQNEDVIVDCNPAYHAVSAYNVIMDTDKTISVPTSPYQTVHPRESVYIATLTNEAYEGVDISTSVNASYQSVQRENDSLEYDYA